MIFILLLVSAYTTQVTFLVSCVFDRLYKINFLLLYKFYPNFATKEFGSGNWKVKLRRNFLSLDKKLEKKREVIKTSFCHVVYDMICFIQHAFNRKLFYKWVRWYNSLVVRKYIWLYSIINFEDLCISSNFNLELI